MSVILRDGITTGQSAEYDTESDPYIRVRDILEIHRAHFPGHYNNTHDTPRGVYDCRVVRQRDIHPFHLRGPAEWADYVQIIDDFEERRAAGGTGHTALVPPDVVFARVKIIIAERDEPIRAVLTFEPVYPRRGKAALLRQGQSLWMAYAALAVLNSALGQALYRQDLLRREGRPRVSDGVSLPGLKELPVAQLGYEPAILERVAHLSYQMVTLYEARRECARDFEEELTSTYERLRWATRELLGLSVEAAEELIKSVADLALPENSRADEQMRLFRDPWELPPHPPVDLLTLDDRINLDGLRSRSAGDKLPENDKQRLQALQCMSDWEAMLKEPPPRDVPLEVPLAEEAESPPFYIENIRGVHLPVRLVRETREGETYEYYPLGTYLVAAPGVCGGRATFKGTRLDVRHVLPEIDAELSFEEINVQFGRLLTPAAVEEARLLASQNEPEVFERPLIPERL